jgi:hypothetical protein
MTSQVSHSGRTIVDKSSTPTIVLLTPKEAAKLLKVSQSWLAKARMRATDRRSSSSVRERFGTTRRRFRSG